MEEKGQREKERKDENDEEKQVRDKAEKRERANTFLPPGNSPATVNLIRVEITKEN